MRSSTGSTARSAGCAPRSARCAPKLGERLGRGRAPGAERIVLRLEGREVETTGVKAILDRHERRLAELGRRLAELEDAGKG
jgi:hypothetical protein